MPWGRLEVLATSPTTTMIRVKIIKEHPKYKVGQVVTETNNVAFGLIDSGYAILTKDMTGSETVTKSGKSK